MSFDRFSVCAAYYAYAVLYHEGQGSKEYAYLGRLEKLGYKPSPAVQSIELDYHASLVFDRLVRARLPVADGQGYRPCQCRDCDHVTLGAFCGYCDEAQCGMSQDCLCADERDVGDCIDDKGVFCCPDCGGEQFCFPNCPSRL